MNALKLACLLVLPLSVGNAGEKWLMHSHGVSMLPSMPRDSIIEVERVEFSDLRVRDVVVYRSATGEQITHRIFKSLDSGRAWWPRGDHNYFADREAVTAKNLVGRVVRVVRVIEN